MTTLRRYWPWWVAIGWLVGYELFAILTPSPTLSQLYWRAQDAAPWLPYLVAAVIVLVCVHLFFKKWGGPSRGA